MTIQAATHQRTVNQDYDYAAVIVPRAVIRNYDRRLFSEVQAAAERGEDGLKLSSSSWGRRPDPDTAVLREITDTRSRIHGYCSLAAQGW